MGPIEQILVFTIKTAIVLSPFAGIIYAIGGFARPSVAG